MILFFFFFFLFSRQYLALFHKGCKMEIIKNKECRVTFFRKLLSKQYLALLHRGCKMEIIKTCANRLLLDKNCYLEP